VENASYGLTCCAERNAIFAAVAAGKHPANLCVVADTQEPVAPCGACRQVMCEFAIKTVWLANCAGASQVMTVEELLPYSFGPDSLATKA
ncbi:MAG: cytidine deaminase, partial [Acidaminococcaceae bacterium]